MRHPQLGERVAAELARARWARQAGNRGRARVCARRAAGWALGGWPTSQTEFQEGKMGDAYQTLRSAAADEALPLPVRLAAGRLIVRVAQAFSLPFDQDPVEDALDIIRWRWPGWQPLHG